MNPFPALSKPHDNIYQLPVLSLDRAPAYATVIPDMSSSPSQSNQSDVEPRNTEPEPSQNRSPVETKSETKVETKSETKVETNDVLDRDQPGGKDVEGGDAGETEEEDEGECGFCLFMKAGGCRDSFTNWENCIEEAERAEENIVEKCYEVTSKLRECMQAHPDYYEPILRAEKVMEEEALKELQQDSAHRNGEGSVDSSSAQDKKSEDKNSEVTVELSVTNAKNSE